MKLRRLSTWLLGALGWLAACTAFPGILVMTWVGDKLENRRDGR